MTLRFEGYAALWDRVDRAGDVFRAGAFGAARTVPLLWQHRGAPVGVAAVREDATGLRIQGQLTDRGLAAMVRDGRLTGLSVGYRPPVAARGRARELIRVRLVEVSLVPVPMQPAARVETVQQEEWV